MTQQDPPPLVLNPRQRELMAYLKNRTKAVSIKTLAWRFNVTTACVSGNLRPLLMAGEVERSFKFEPSSLAGKISRVSYYRATKPVPSKIRRPKTSPTMFNDPFNLGQGRERVNTQPE